MHEGMLCSRQACDCENWLETTCEGSKWKWRYVSWLAMNVPIVSGAAPVTWSMRYWRRQWCWGCGCCRFCCRWRHAGGVPGGDWGSYISVKFHAIGDCSPNTLLKQEGLQLAKASFGEKPMVFWLQLSRISCWFCNQFWEPSFLPGSSDILD